MTTGTERSRPKNTKAVRRAALALPLPVAPQGHAAVSAVIVGFSLETILPFQHWNHPIYLVSDAQTARIARLKFMTGAPYPNVCGYFCQASFSDLEEAAREVPKLQAKIARILKPRRYDDNKESPRQFRRPRT